MTANRGIMAGRVERLKEKVQITCIACPKGCRAELTAGSGGVVDVSGTECKRGQEYVMKEFKDPVRVLTSTVRIEGGGYLPVRTRGAIPKTLIFHVMAALRPLVCRPPLGVGDVVCPNVLGTGVDLVASAPCGKSA